MTSQPTPAEDEPVRGVPFGLSYVLLRWRQHAEIWSEVRKKLKEAETLQRAGAVVVTLPFRKDGSADAPKSELVLR